MPSAPVVLVLTKPLSLPSFLLFLLSLLIFFFVSCRGKGATVTHKLWWCGVVCGVEAAANLESAVGLSWWWLRPLVGCQRGCLDRGAAQGLSQPVNIPPSEPPRAATISSAHSQKEMDYNHFGARIHLFSFKRSCGAVQLCIRWMFVQVGLKP